MVDLSLWIHLPEEQLECRRRIAELEPLPWDETAQVAVPIRTVCTVPLDRFVPAMRTPRAYGADETSSQTRYNVQKGPVRIDRPVTCFVDVMTSFVSLVLAVSARVRRKTM